MTALLIVLLVPGYMLCLFALARRADRRERPERPWLRAVSWALSVSVYTASWIYFSSVGSVARGNSWGILTTYGGPILALALLSPVIIRIARIVRRENIVSIADFLSARYGKSRIVGILVALLALVATLPFVAQQIRALAMAWRAVGQGGNPALVFFVLAAMLAGFAILFGARRPVLTEHNRGLVRAVALESLFKIVMLVLLGAGGLWLMRAAAPAALHAAMGSLASPPRLGWNTLYGMMVAVSGLLIAPRQFYLAFVELETPEDVKAGRWLLALYILLAWLLVLAIAVGGNLAFRGSNPDMYILALAGRFGGEGLLALAFLGAFSAVAAPVMVEALALSTMVSNELVLPLLVRGGLFRGGARIGDAIVNIRRATICGLLMLAWLYAFSVKQTASLGVMGAMTSAGIVQFLPAVLGGLYWRRGHAAGAIAGLCGGFACWLYLLALPQILSNFGIEAFFPAPDFVQAGRSMVCIGVNLALYIGVSLAVRPRLIDRIQAAAFLDISRPPEQGGQRGEFHGTVADLKALASQFLGEREAADAFEEIARSRKRPLKNTDRIDPAMVRATERMLAGVVGASLARRLIGWQLSNGNWEAADMLKVLDDTAQAVQFNRDLLHATLDHMSQAVYVVDRDGRLVAWNKRYIEQFNFPPGFIHIGQPVGEAIRWMKSRTGIPESEIADYVAMRLAQVRQGIAYAAERILPDGSVLKIIGSPMPGGRYVTSFTDVTELRQSARALEQANEKLEERVAARTHELTDANAALKDAKARAERVSNSQAKFLAAVSHDLLQPLNAARLFMGALREEGAKIASHSAVELATNADLAVDTANRLLRALLNLSRLEAGGTPQELAAVDLASLMEELRREFEPLAAKKRLRLRLVASRCSVLSDRDLLRSVLQNLIGNAIRYTKSGGVVVGCRRRGDRLSLQVHDTGPGIADESLRLIFDEFSRLPGTVDTGPGAGLGLAIAQRICNQLGHELTVRSKVGHGSLFAVSALACEAAAPRRSAPALGRLAENLKVLCVDNDPSVLEAMAALLGRWDVAMACASSMSEALALAGPWDVVLADYHLGADGSGLDLIEKLDGRSRLFALITADQSETMLAKAAALEVEVVQKPVSPAYLRFLLSRAGRRTTVAKGAMAPAAE
jgi:signal transduction histidine kinase/Na+/proline symporter/CheY-like chemotaxis protein